jgi:hypothetical protein
VSAAAGDLSRSGGLPGITDYFGNPVYGYYAELPVPVTLQAGTLYLLAVSEQTPGVNWAWLTSSTQPFSPDPALFNYHYARTSDAAPWVQTFAYESAPVGVNVSDEGALAFTLTSAPEPGPLMLATVTVLVGGGCWQFRRHLPRRLAVDATPS